MTKFKKMFLAGLTLFLTISMALQTAPAFALDNGSGTSAVLSARPIQGAVANINNVAVLEIYPPRLKISGTLPTRCFHLSISIQGVSSIAPNGGAKTLIIWVRGVTPFGMLCVRGIKSFSTTVTLDPGKLKLAPGKYVVMVNPVNGQSQFKMRFTVPAPKPQTVLPIATEIAAPER